MNAHIWHWAVSPRISGEPWPLSLYFRRPLKMGGLPTSFVIRLNKVDLWQSYLIYKKVLENWRKYELRKNE